MRLFHFIVSHQLKETTPTNFKTFEIQAAAACKLGGEGVTMPELYSQVAQIVGVAERTVYYSLRK